MWAFKDHQTKEWSRSKVKPDIEKVYVWTILGDSEVRIVARGEGHNSKIWMGNRLENFVDCRA
jgi:uncharacterized protein (DUF2147 family)